MVPSVPRRTAVPERRRVAPTERIAEGVCAENRNEYYNNKESDVPKAEKPDF